MDNNFNQQQAGQPVYQQQMPQQQVPVQQAPQQPMYQQMPAQQMPQQPMYQQAPKQPSNMSVMALIAIICSGVGLLMSVLGTLFYCSCSASATFESGSDGYTNSAVMIVAILGVLVAVAGVVCAILAIKKDGEKAGKMAYIAAAVGVFAVLYGIIPTLTICGYNCSLNSAKDSVASSYSSLLGY